MIIFKELQIKNFLSTGDDALTYILNKSPTTIITGSNGVGKTTIVDGLTFALFGKSFRDIKKGSLINSINKKDSYASIKFTKGNSNYQILRGQKPHRLEVQLNGQLMHENASITETQKYIENQILGFDYNTFTRVCVMSTMNYTPFMALTSYERRNFVENMLDLKMFSEMNKLHKSETILLKDSLAVIDSNLAIIDSKILEKRNFMDYIKSNSDDDLDLYKNKLKEYLDEIAEVDKKIKEFSSKENVISQPLEDAQNQLKEIHNVNRKHRSDIAIGNSKIADNQKTINYVQDHDDCEMCKQTIDESNAEKIIKKLEDTNSKINSGIAKAETEIKNTYDSQQTLENKINEFTTLSNTLEQKINGLNQLKSILTKNAKEASENIKRISDKSNHNFEEIENDVKLLIKQHDILKLEFEEKTEELKLSNIVLELLKDTGIKADIIKQYIPMLCAYVNSYLGKLNISLTFDMDENFNESISTRYTSDFTYNNLSAGERSRVDLALAFAWRNVAKAKGSVNTNLLILDEVLDANLDESGTAASLEIVNDISQDNTNVFIVSHKSNLEEHCRSVLSLEKVNGFTRIK